jgi:hypothetical protein
LRKPPFLFVQRYLLALNPKDFLNEVLIFSTLQAANQQKYKILQRLVALKKFSETASFVTAITCIVSEIHLAITIHLAQFLPITLSAL